MSNTTSTFRGPSPQWVLAAAEKRLRPMVARGTPHEDVLSTFQTFTRWYDHAVEAHSPVVVDDDPQWANILKVVA